MTLTEKVIGYVLVAITLPLALVVIVPVTIAYATWRTVHFALKGLDWRSPS